MTRAETAADVEITFRGVGKSPLRRRYPGQLHDQAAFVEVNPEACALTADFSGEIGDAVPVDVYQGRRLRFAVRNTLGAGQIRRLLDGLRSDVAILIQGYSTHWDGSNMRGRLDDEALDARDRIKMACAEA